MSSLPDATALASALASAVSREESNEGIYSVPHALDDLNLPPGRMNATRVPERLSGSACSSPAQLGRKTISLERPRSKSPHTSANRTMSTLADGNSSLSSLDDIVDQDILYDRQGLSELDANDSQRKMHNSREFVNLPPVNERLSEDTLEDCHAFSDAVRSSNASRVSVGTGTDNVLEPLTECGEDEDDDELDHIEEEETVAVILTNMENLNLNSARGRGEAALDSLAEEAPSAPTA